MVVPLCLASYYLTCLMASVGPSVWFQFIAHSSAVWPFTTTTSQLVHQSSVGVRWFCRCALRPTTSFATWLQLDLQYGIGSLHIPLPSGLVLLPHRSWSLSSQLVSVGCWACGHTVSGVLHCRSDSPKGVRAGLRRCLCLFATRLISKDLPPSLYSFSMPLWPCFPARLVAFW